MHTQYHAYLEVNLAHLRENYTILQKKSGAAECAAVVKADAYGVGLEPIVKALGEVRTFFVAHAEEGLRLRSYVPQGRIFVLHGFLPGQAAFMKKHHLIPVLNSREQVHEWRRLCRGTRYPAAIQLDTGMSRFGLSWDDLHDDALSDLDLVLVLSHLACADDPSHPANEKQRDVFIRMADHFPGVPRSLSASSGIFLGERYHFDLVRPGAALYGLAPNRHENPLKPVIRLEARILQMRDLSSGDAVGYGLTWQAQEATRIATVGIGYADGFWRGLSGRLSLWYGDIPLPLVGRVSMDSISVDVSKIPLRDLKRGDYLTVIGPRQSVDDLAQAAGTIGYEVLTSLGQRFERRYLG